MVLMDGKKLAEKIHAELRREGAEFNRTTGATPGLAAIRVGANEASKVYVDRKAKMCGEVGMHSRKLELPESTSEKELLSAVEPLNRDAEIHGILVQLPLPKHISADRVSGAVRVEKDVDGFHVVNA